MTRVKLLAVVSASHTGAPAEALDVLFSTHFSDNASWEAVDDGRPHGRPPWSPWLLAVIWLLQEIGE